MATEVKQKIILGYGKFYIDEIELGLTRGGGQFIVEAENRVVEADGAKCAIKGNIVRDREQPKLTVNLLSIFQGADLTKLYAGLKAETVASGEDAGVHVTSTGKDVYDNSDYHTVKWVGQNGDGEMVKIIIENAINLENIDWSLVDKDEVVQALTFTGCGDMETKRCSYKIVFPKPAA